MIRLYRIGNSQVLHGVPIGADRYGITFCGRDMNVVEVTTHGLVRSDIGRLVTCRRCLATAAFRDRMEEIQYSERMTAGLSTSWWTQPGPTVVVEMPDATSNNTLDGCTCALCVPDDEDYEDLPDEEPRIVVPVEWRPLVTAQPIDPMVWKSAQVEWRARENGTDTGTRFGYCDCGKHAIGVFPDGETFRPMCKRHSMPVAPIDQPVILFATRRGKHKSTTVNRRFRKGA